VVLSRNPSAHHHHGGREIKRGGFADPAWVEHWDVAFADLYLDARNAGMTGQTPARPWAVTFGAPAGLPPLRHVLLGMNAHINFDLTQALVAVITDEQFDYATLLARREADDRAIDAVLASRVAAEDDELTSISGPAPVLDRLLRPASRPAFPDTTSPARGWRSRTSTSDSPRARHE
jgi:hypothetical protein